MGKRTDKSGKGGGANSANSRIGDDCLTPQPYTCTGNFVDDFGELWLRSGFAKNYVVNVQPRAKLPPPPTTAEDDENDEKVLNESVPTTYTLANNSKIMRPSIEVEYELEETKNLQINYAKEMFIRSWKLEDKVLNVLQLCSLDRLQCINLWNAGLDASLLKSFGSFLSTLPSLKTLVLDGNPIETEPFDLLLSHEILVQNLYLRNNQITDKGVKKIAKCLGDANTRLVSLNLSFNRIADAGAMDLAASLRLNRSLLSLSLASNHITDEGCKAFASVLQRFPLTHDEVVLRRRLISQHGFAARATSASGSRPGDAKDRPSSNKSGSVVAAKGNRGSSKKKDPKKTEVPEKTPKKDERSKKGAAGSNESTKGGKGKKSGVPKDGVKRGTAASSTVDIEPNDTVEYTHPLLDPQSEHADGKVFIPGCFTLVNLNLSRNRISIAGLKSLWTTLQYQSSRQRLLLTSPAAPGILRLSLQKNRFPTDHQIYHKLQEMLVARDPMNKIGNHTPDDEGQSMDPSAK